MDLPSYITTYKETSSKTVQAIDAAELQKAISIIHDARKRGSNVFCVGVGGSAGTANHFSSDLFKWATGEGKQPIKAFCLSDNTPLLTALTNDNGWADVFTEQLKTLAKPRDVIVAFSVHGGSGKDKAGAWSQNVLQAVEYVKNINGKAIGITGFDGGAMKSVVDAHINVPIDSTAHVEGLHLVISHMIVDALKELALHEHEQKTGEKIAHRL
ncbi:MAG: SIS domain-containing protein [Nanoarchaeota archaeon]